MKVLVATEKPFAKVAVDGIRKEIEAAGYELALLEKYTDKAQLLDAVKDEMCIRDSIKEMAIASLKDSTMMYYSCDVGKFLNSDRGLLDVKNYDYDSLMGTTFGMDKKQRIQSFASSSSHAMTLMAVDLDKNGKPTKWMVENSWGAGAGYQGHLIMTDEWFNEYTCLLYTSPGIRWIGHTFFGIETVAFG